MKTSSHTNSSEFEKNLEKALLKLQAVPQNKKTDEIATPLYLHKNFLVRKTLIDRFKIAYKMTSYRNKSVLDFGCGGGMFLQALSSEITKGIGVDIDTDVAKKVIDSDKIIIKQINNENEIEDFSNIDIITSFDVLEHIKNLDPLFDSFKKILSPSGIIIISGPTENSLYRLARKITRFGLKGNILGEEEHVSNIVDIKNKMVQSGFKIIKNVNLWSLFHITCFSVEN